MPRPTITVTWRIPAELHARLREAARRTGLSMNGLVVAALENHLGDEDEMSSNTLDSGSAREEGAPMIVDRAKADQAATQLLRQVLPPNIALPESIEAKWLAVKVLAHVAGDRKLKVHASQVLAALGTR